ncbi:hypothetical protein H2202_010158 [Exophiala xenobiotica]|nr:hypothetical protein H2202_010158 [Exophiala xenobiotica]
MPKLVGKNGDEAVPTCGRCDKSGRWCDRSQSLRIRAQKNVGKHDEAAIHALGATQAKTADIRDPQSALQDEDIAQYFEHYLKELAPWYDLNDLDMTFAVVVARRALRSQLLLSAIIAFAAVHKSRTGHAASKTLAETHHAHCLRLLIGLDNDGIEIRDGTALAATCLLRSYEILSEEEDPNRHLFGAFSLIPLLSSALPSEQLLRAGLWNYLREDITFSLINECPLKIELGEVNVEPRRDDDYASQITLLLGRLINAAFAKEQLTVERLRQAVSHWYSTCPFRPYHESHGSGFPRIRMLQNCHSMHYYYVAMCLVDVSNARPARLEEYARLICGSTFTANNDPTMVNAYGPICYSAKWLRRDDDRREVVNRLLASQRRTGWPVQTIVVRLKEQWLTGTERFEFTVPPN